MNASYTIRLNRFGLRGLKYDVVDDEIRLVARSFATLNDAAEWITRPRCVWEESFAGIGGVDDLPGDGWISEVCEREATTRLVVESAYVDHRDLWTVCDGHAVRVRTEDLGIVVMDDAATTKEHTS